MHLNHFIRTNISIKLVSKCLLTLLNSCTSFNLYFFYKGIEVSSLKLSFFYFVALYKQLTSYAPFTS